MALITALACHDFACVIHHSLFCLWIFSLKSSRLVFGTVKEARLLFGCCEYAKVMNTQVIEFHDRRKNTSFMLPSCSQEDLLLGEHTFACRLIFFVAQVAQPQLPRFCAVCLSSLSSRQHAWHRKVRHLPKSGPRQDVQWALVVELLLLWGCWHRSCWKSILWRRSCEHLPPLQVRDDWRWRPLLLQHPCLLMHHWSVLLTSSTWIPNLCLLQQKACWWWWMEWPAAVWLVH